MNLLQKHIKRTMPRHQKGALLIVALIMVLLMTIVGMAAIRGTGLQESMAGNVRERNIAFQAAESALRSGEAVVSPKNKVLPPSDCLAGMCPDQNAVPANSVSNWDKLKWSSIAVAAAFDVKDTNITPPPPPRYVIEEIFVSPVALAAKEGSAIDVGGIQTTGAPTPYRISARGIGIATEADVVVQSIFARRFK